MSVEEFEPETLEVPADGVLRVRAGDYEHNFYLEEGDDLALVWRPGA